MEEIKKIKKQLIELFKKIQIDFDDIYKRLSNLDKEFGGITCGN